NIWRYEGIGYYVYDGGTSRPVYRFWSDAYLGHFYTSSEAEKNGVINNYPDNVWRYEGVAYYLP
ncbi:MAG: hypothetical protein U9Q67_03780, partial [Patescibacteria group bacterium]|nr:hypothetical protein [Patescibacteria group bacterium]